MNNNKINLNAGGGGFKSWEIVKGIREILKDTGEWTNTDDDGAVIDLGGQKLVFSTDGFIVDPIFFPGGDIGKIAMSGTINDVSVMGAKPIGISLSIIIEEGFSANDFDKIIKSINKVSREAGVPVVTGDTKVTEKGKIDKISITTSGVGICKDIISSNGAKPGDVIITSGDLGEHAATLLAQRFNYKTKIKSDSKVLNKELLEAGKYMNTCKDPTRGGLAANIVEIADKSEVKIVFNENELPYKKEVKSIADLLGLDYLAFASEGRFIASVLKKDTDKVLSILKKYNPEARAIGEVVEGKGVFVKTKIGSMRPVKMPDGKLIPRIC